ncbi:MAG: sugar ABC transporter permease [Actinobacteria bacterium]|nr:sugar ABC transporter permease [Actinomycetota bacterium]
MNVPKLESNTEFKQKIESYKIKGKIRYGIEDRPFIFIFPAMLPILFIILYPVFYNLYISFFRTNLAGIGTRRWIGFQNFIDLLSSGVFWKVLSNTIIWVIGITFLLELLALFAALLLNQKIHGRGIFRTILLLPWVIPGVVTGILWRYMFDAKFGVINDILLRLNLIKDYVPWLAQMNTSLLTVMIAYIWKVFPMIMIIILASLQGIPNEIYDAALIDGAGHWQTLRYIVLPLIKNAISITILFTVILAFNSFDLTYVMTGGGPVNSSEILGMYIFNLGFRHVNFGAASATGTLMFIVSLGLIIFYVKRQSRQ